MDPDTVGIYERGARRYATDRRAYDAGRASRFATELPDGGLRLDLGAGPGHYLPYLGTPVIATDASPAMLRAARRRAPVPVVAGDLEAIPFREGSFAGVWASKSLQHVPAERLPLALAGVHRALATGGRLDVSLFAGEGSGRTPADDDFPGRLFCLWRPAAFERVLVGAGFEVEEVEVRERGDPPLLTALAQRARTLADTVGPGMSLLVCGLNPSLYAADAGVGFARPGNRFWPAALAAGLVTVDRDPVDALRRHGVGMTDLVKRATAAASELHPDEYRRGLERVEHLVAWLRPAALCFVGLAGWRAAVDRNATPGVQPVRIADVPVYLMPSTSGLNARSSLPDLTAHLRSAAALAGGGGLSRCPGEHAP